MIFLTCHFTYRLAISSLFIALLGCNELHSQPNTKSPNSTTLSCEHSKDRFNCVKFIKNYDGDTLTFDIPNTHPLLGSKINVRVLGLDTPEIKGRLPCEKEAARTAQRLIENLLKKAQRVDLVNVERDKYFRILAEVQVDGRSIKDVLIKNGLAYAYDGGTKQKINWCNRGIASE